MYNLMIHCWRLYQTAMSTGNPHEPIDYRGIAKALGQKETAIKNIIKHLAQANFIKKLPDNSVYLTPNGISLVENLKKER